MISFQHSINVFIMCMKVICFLNSSADLFMSFSKYRDYSTADHIDQIFLLY